MNFEQIFERRVTGEEEEEGILGIGRGPSRQIKGEESRVFGIEIMMGESTDLPLDFQKGQVVRNSSFLSLLPKGMRLGPGDR